VKTLPRPVTIQSVEVTPVTFKLRKPFVTAAGQKSHTHNVQIRITLSDGTIGLSEASSSIAMPKESQDAMSRVLREMIPELRRHLFDDIRSLSGLVWRLQPLHPTAAAAMECALIDAFARSKRQSLALYFGGKSLAVETDLTLSVDTPARLHTAAKAAVRAGFRKIKIKLSGVDPVLDVERMKAVHRGAPRAKLVADGNQGFGLSHAITFIHALERAQVPLVFFEQPFPKQDFPSMRQFRRRSHVPLFADESVLSAADATKVFESGAADGVNVKVAKSGLFGALDILHVARRYGKRMAIGCMEESKLGLAASVHLACGTAGFEWIDLDSIFLLEKQQLRGGFCVKGPVLSVKGIKAGIGIS
jgi:L-alanine-DL-glutamate epimerase-like enolase superfamily enzyme